MKTLEERVALLEVVMASTLRLLVLMQKQLQVLTLKPVHTQEKLAEFLALNTAVKQQQALLESLASQLGTAATKPGL
jgi:hypothetical protein